MTPRKLIGFSAALIAIGAGVLLLVSREDADDRSVEVLLRPPSTAVEIPAAPAVRLTVPRRYIAPHSSLSDAKSGVGKLILDIELAELLRCASSSQRATHFPTASESAAETKR